MCVTVKLDKYALSNKCALSLKATPTTVIYEFITGNQWMFRLIMQNWESVTTTLFLGTGSVVQSILGFGECSNAESVLHADFGFADPEVWFVVSCGPVAILA